MVFWVQDPKYGGHTFPVGTQYRILRANRRTFTFQEFPFGEMPPNGPPRTWKCQDWKMWLGGVCKGKDVFLNGRRMVLPEPEQRICVRMDTVARDLRLRRAAAQVLKDYGIRAVEVGTERIEFEVRKDAETAYVVSVQRDWSRSPACNCPDAARNLAGVRSGAWCKHVMAVLMSREELRGQLLDLFL